MFLLRAGVPHRPQQLYRLSQAGQESEDVLEFLEQRMVALGTGYHSLDGTDEGYRVKKVRRRSRALWVKVNRGPAGSPGETFDLDTAESRSTTARQALLSGLRAMFVVPTDAYYGLLFVERAGRRNLRDLLLDAAVTPTSQTVGAVIRVEAFAELSRWRQELADQQVLRVSETLVKRDSGDDASSVDDTVIDIVAHGRGLSGLTERVAGAITDRVRRRDETYLTLQRLAPIAERRREAEAGQAVAFQDEEEFQALLRSLREGNAQQEEDPELIAAMNEVIEVDREGLQHQRFQVALGDTAPRRTIVIERERLPTLAYVLGGRLTDGALRNTWEAHAETILESLGVSLPSGWQQP